MSQLASPNEIKKHKVLIITSSAGGGLLQAAVAQEQQILEEASHIQIIKRDVLKDWIWRWLGKYSIESWNRAQKKGNLRYQKFCASSQWLFDYIAWPSVFFHTLRLLLKENVDRVIDTQSQATIAIVKAIRFFNKKRSKQIVLEKIIVDLPTKKATHFFRSIKELSQEDKKYLKLRTIPPLLEEGQTREDFWQAHCGLSESDICYEDVNVRRSFRALQGKPRSENTVFLHLVFNEETELNLMRKTWERGSIRSQIEAERVLFEVSSHAKVFTILLGSQPSHLGTLEYVRLFIDFAKQNGSEKNPIYLFVFCGEYSRARKSLFRDVVELVKREENYPSHLSIIPFSFQSDDAIAPLFHRSDITCSRSGGQTAMELMAVSTGEIWIHSEAKLKSGDASLSHLLKGIPVWESESALYLVKNCAAKVVTPEIFLSAVGKVFGDSVNR